MYIYICVPFLFTGCVNILGISTKSFPVYSNSRDLIGITRNSWGWNLYSNYVLHNNQAFLFYNYRRLKNYISEEGQNIIRMVLDCDNGRLHFEICNVLIEDAFINLPKAKFYPTISSIGGMNNITIKYIGDRLLM